MLTGFRQVGGRTDCRRSEDVLIAAPRENPCGLHRLLYPYLPADVSQTVHIDAERISVCQHLLPMHLMADRNVFFVIGHFYGAIRFWALQRIKAYDIFSMSVLTSHDLFFVFVENDAQPFCLSQAPLRGFLKRNGYFLEETHTRNQQSAYCFLVSTTRDKLNSSQVVVIKPKQTVYYTVGDV